jgi:hypothetical protein
MMKRPVPFYDEEGRKRQTKQVESLKSKIDRK